MPCLHYVDIIKPSLRELLAMSAELRHRRSKPPITAAKSAQACELLRSSASADPTSVRILGSVLLHVWMLLCEGVGALLISLGEHGCAVCQMVHAADARRRVPLGAVDCAHPDAVLAVTHVPALPCTVVNTTGAGDCMAAGALCALRLGMDLVDAACVGTAAAHCSCCSADNVPEGLTWGAVQPKAEAAKAQAVQLLWGVERAHRHAASHAPVAQDVGW